VVSAAMVKELRERTGAGMMDCKKALAENNGDMDKSIEFLREKGLAAAAKKAGRIAAEGLVDAYIHGAGRIGVLVEVNCETDFVAKTDDFKNFVRDIAMHIAAAKPEYVKRDEVSEEIIESEKKIYKAQAMEEGKPENIAEKMVTGRVEKFLKEICLYEQVYVKNPDLTIEKYVNEKIAKIGEQISIRRFQRFEMGEGLEKRSEDFAAEVAAEMNK
jgi:elongation factor Ts